MLRNFKPEAPSVQIWSTLFALAYLASSETSARAVTMYKFTVILRLATLLPDRQYWFRTVGDG